VKNNITFFIFFISLSSQIILGQTLYRAKIRGKIMVNAVPVSGATIVNLNNQSTTQSELDGTFSILVRAGDIVMFAASNLKACERTITTDDVNVGTIIVSMNEVAIQLNEVIIKDASNISAESIGIIPYGQKRYTQAERHLQTAGDFKPIMLLSIIGGGMPLDPLINKINGRTKRLKKLVVLEKKIAYLQKIDSYFEESYFVNKLKIPKEHVLGFEYYAVENSEFVASLKNNDKVMMGFLLIDLASQYREIIACEKY
jgi:hypothetical protein